MVEETPKFWQDRLDDAIRESLDEGEMVMRWLTVVEVMDEDGDRVLYTLTSPSLQSWEGLGMLRYAQAQQEFVVQAEAAFILGGQEEQD
jgi:hypothetical protein